MSGWQLSKLCNLLPSSSHIGRNAVHETSFGVYYEEDVLVNGCKVIVYVYRKSWTLKQKQEFRPPVYSDRFDFTFFQKRFSRFKISILFLFLPYPPIMTSILSSRSSQEWPILLHFFSVNLFHLPLSNL